MDMTGEYRIPAPRQLVWEALNDPDVLRQAIPGCQSLDKVSDTELTAKVKAKVGPVNATFNGKVTLGDLNPPASYTISGEGSGGVAGFARGGAKVDLTEDGPDATTLRYDAKADVGGKLAQIGSRMVQGTARKMADEFFGNFSRIVGESAARPAPAAPDLRSEPRPAEAAPHPRETPPPAGTVAPPSEAAPGPRETPPAAAPAAQREAPARQAATPSGPAAEPEKPFWQKPMAWGIAVVVLILLWLLLV